MVGGWLEKKKKMVDRYLHALIYADARDTTYKYLNFSKISRGHRHRPRRRRRRHRRKI